MRFGLAVRLCGAMALLGLTACGPRGMRGEGQAEPQDSVALGYGGQSPKNVTGSVSSITPGGNEASSAGTMIDYLEGRVPGLRVVRLGQGEVQLIVRGGQSTFGKGADASALLVIDDKMIEYGVAAQLNSLRPENVQRVDVIKDASAAIYGSRGANGVVIITTKRPPR